MSLWASRSQSASRARTWRACLSLLRRDIHAPLDTRPVLNNDISASLWHIVCAPAYIQCEDLSFIQPGIREFDNLLSGMREVNARQRGADSHRLLLSKCHGILVLPIGFHRWNIRLLTWAACDTLATVYVAAKGNTDKITWILVFRLLSLKSIFASNQLCKLFCWYGMQLYK